jgi:hypothetical protein
LLLSGGSEFANALFQLVDSAAQTVTIAIFASVRLHGFLIGPACISVIIETATSFVTSIV